MQAITISEKSARARIGSDIVLVDGWGITSSIGPIDLENDRVPLPEGVENQARKVFANLEVLLKAAGLGRENVVAVRVYLVEAPRLLERLNSAYVGFFSSDRPPARSLIGVQHLTRGAQVEMEFVLSNHAA
jgi:enamine deaminase RidA (YjgF/YER057c/UK114 family)